MNTSLFKYLMLSMFSLVFFCTCDKDDELSGEEFRVTMENRFFSIKTSKTFTKKDGSTEIMQEGKSYLADSPSTIWFHDSKLYIPIQISSKDTLWQKWNAYQREKGLGNILLLVGHKYMYESQGNGLITPDQLLVHEQLGGRFYLGNYILLYTITKIIKGHITMYPFIIQSFFSFFFPFPSFLTLQERVFRKRGSRGSIFGL